MAKSKGTRTRRKRKNAFPEIRGKIVEGVELMPSENGYSIGIMFQDRTYLSFDVEPYITVFPELSDRKTENYKPLKRWPIVRS
ncbi:MAG: hypothetical protein ACXV7C_12895 [Candidatus Angelobacter sp.]